MSRDRIDRTRRRIVAASAAACATRLAGAQPRSREIVDATGRTIVLPERVQRILAAGPPASVLAFAVAPDKLIGWTTSFRAAERPFVPQRYADLPTLGRLTGRGNTANVEVVLAAKPDVIVDYGSVSPTFASLAARVQEQTGIPYALLDGAFDRMEASIRAMGALAQEPVRGDSLAAYASDTVSEITRRVAAIPRGERPRVYYARGPRGLETGLAGSINVESIERVGAINVAAELGSGGLVQLSLEHLLRWDPQVIVTTDPNFAEAVMRDASWRSITAVKDGRIHLAPAVPFGWIDFPPSINRLIGLRWLARLLYPAAFAEDLRPIVRDFHVRLYHQAPSDAQIDALLSTLPARRGA